MDYIATNQANIARLRENRDRAGLLQLADAIALSGHHDASAVIADARAAVEWIDRTSPATVSATHAHDVRVGDIITYDHAGHSVQGIVLARAGDVVTTNLGHDVHLTA